MTREEFSTLKMSSLLLNNELGIICEIITEWNKPLEEVSDEQANHWTRNAVKETGFDENGCGDISIKDCEKWSIYAGPNSITNKDFRMFVLERELRICKQLIFTYLNVRERDTILFLV